MALLPRQFVGGTNNNNGNNVCYNSYGQAYYCQSGWYSWGRWVVLGIIVFVAFLIFFLTSCLSARRRRKLGNRPYYGTGWTGAPFGHGAARYNPNYQSQQAPPQEYDTAPTYQSGGYYGQNQGYFGGQQTGTELREPETAYTNGGDDVYQPPNGPPPKMKGDGIVR